MVRTFVWLFAHYNWWPIRGCPGRYILKISGPKPGCRELAEGFRCFRLSGAIDPVHVAVIPGGGIISYEHTGGDFLHTLGTPAGFRRKLRMLGLEPDLFFTTNL